MALLIDMNIVNIPNLYQSLYNNNIDAQFKHLIAPCLSRYSTFLFRLQT
jgi:hypothetical protein